MTTHNTASNFQVSCILPPGITLRVVAQVGKSTVQSRTVENENSGLSINDEGYRQPLIHRLCLNSDSNYQKDPPSPILTYCNPGLETIYMIHILVPL